MKKRDLWVISSKYEKINKNKKINIAIIVLSIIVVFMAYLSLSFNFRCKYNLNKYKEILTINVDYRKGQNELYDVINNNIKSTEIVTYGNIEISNDSYSSFGEHFCGNEEAWNFIIDGKYNYINNPISHDKGGISWFSFGVFFDDLSTSFILKSEEEYMKRNNFKLFLSGTSFQNENDIIISSKFADILGLNYDEIVNKPMSFACKLSEKECLNMYVRINDTKIDEMQYKDQEYYIFKDFNICGIINDELFNAESRGSSPNFWILDDVIDLSYTAKKEGQYSIYYDYSDDIINVSNEVTNNGKFFIPLGFGSLDDEYDQEISQIFQIKSFEKLYSIKNGNNIFKKNDIEKYFYYTQSYCSYDKYYQAFNYINIMTIIVSVIMFLIYILVNYIIINDDYKKKEAFLYTLKAIGMKKKDVFSIYLFKSIKSLIKLCLAILISSFIISLGFSLIFNELAVNRFDDTMIFDGFKIYYYPIVFVMFFTVIIIISILINAIVYKKNSNKKIYDVLNTQFER